MKLKLLQANISDDENSCTNLEQNIDKLNQTTLRNIIYHNLMGFSFEDEMRINYAQINTLHTYKLNTIN